MTLTKQQAIEIFGSQAEISRALNVTRGAISLWPDQLSQRQTDELVGAAGRLSKSLPEGFVVAPTDPAAQTEQPAVV